MKQITKIILLLISLFLTGCSSENSSVSKQITFGHFVSDESELNSPDYAEFYRKKNEWMRTANNSIEELVYSDGKYGIEMAMRATTHIMPDIFLVPSGSIRTYVYNDLILDLTPYTNRKADYRNFTFEEKIYAFPIFSPNGGVILYDPDYYKTGFPNNWDEVDDHSIGFSGSNYSNISNLLFNPIAGEITGNSWIEEQILKEGNHSFYDPEIIDAIAKVQGILHDKVNEDYSKISDDEVKEQFLNRSYHAILCSRMNAEEIQKEFPEAQIAGIPGTSEQNYCFGHNYGIAIRSDIEEDKLETCLSFCRAMMNDEMPEGIIPMTYSMDSAIWSTFGSNIADEEKKPEEIAWATQDAYEKYWAYDGGPMGFLLGLSE